MKYTISPLVPSDPHAAFLSQFNPVFDQFWVKETCLYSRPRWERDIEATHQPYFRLVTSDGREILSEGAKALREMTLIGFHDLLVAGCRRQRL